MDRLDVDCGSNASISEFKLVRDGDGEEKDQVCFPTRPLSGPSLSPTDYNEVESLKALF